MLPDTVENENKTQECHFLRAPNGFQSPLSDRSQTAALSYILLLFTNSHQTWRKYSSQHYTRCLKAMGGWEDYCETEREHQYFLFNTGARIALPQLGSRVAIARTGSAPCNLIHAISHASATVLSAND